MVSGDFCRHDWPGSGCPDCRAEREACAPAIPCAHIAAWYQIKWERNKCIAFNLLRQGYRKWAEGSVKLCDIAGWNNLYEPED